MKQNRMEQTKRWVTGRGRRSLLKALVVVAPILLCIGCGQDEDTSQNTAEQQIALTAQETGENGPGLMKIAVDEEVLEAVREKAANETVQEEAEAEKTVVSGGAAAEEAFSLDTADFAMMLLRNNLEKTEENVMVSPASVLTALTMTANGAKGDTQSQMLSLLAPRQDQDSLNDNLKVWLDSLVNSEGAKMNFANSIWFDKNVSDVTLKEEFLQKTKAYFDAEVCQEAFDAETLTNINHWVSEKTDGQIPQILDEIPADTFMYLINAASFDAEWRDSYADYQIKEGIFTNINGVEETVSMMHSEEDTYLADENATGFIKPYKEGYHFVALLPDEGMGVEEYVKNLDGQHFLSILAEAKTEVSVTTAMPKFEAEYEIELNEILQDMGMTEALDPVKADFQGMFTNTDRNAYISQVLHKTHIAVDELGTKAGAVTSVGIARLSILIAIESYTVYLDRPFIYAIVEDQTNLPLFIGVVNQLNN